MRRLLLIVCAIVLVDVMLYAALVPLLPEYADEFALSKTGAGLLLGAYAAGVLIGALPSGFAAARFGARNAALGGLALVAVASVGFAFAGDAWTLGFARLVQGLGSALSWAGGLAWLVAASPRERRGEMLGTALGAAIFGALLGPVLGGAASVVGTRPAFVAVALLAGVLAVAAARTPGAPPEPTTSATLRGAFADRRFLGGLWLMLLPAVLFGTLAVLVPLELASFGWTAAAIGAVFVVGAGLEAAVSPFLGRLTDRRGRLGLVRLALAASVAVSLALAWAAEAALVAALVVAASLAYGALFPPSMTLLSEGAERARLSQGVAFGLMNAAWALGNAVGPAGGGALGEAAGDAAAFTVAAGVCAVTLIPLVSGRIPVGTRFPRVPEQS